MLAWLMPLHTPRVQHIWCVSLSNSLRYGVQQTSPNPLAVQELGWMMDDEWWWLITTCEWWTMNHDESWWIMTLQNMCPAHILYYIIIIYPFQAHWFVPCPKDYDKVVTDPVAVEGTSREAMLVREIEDRAARDGQHTAGECRRHVGLSINGVSMGIPK